MNIGLLFCIIACLSFGMLCYAAVCEFRDYFRGKRKVRKALDNQKKAAEIAGSLIVFDQAMTREKLFRDWSGGFKEVDIDD